MSGDPLMLGDMKVRRIYTETGYHIEPPIDPDWSDLTRLRWAAAVEEIDTPIRIHVTHGTSSYGGTVYDDFCVSVYGTGFGSTDFERALSLIHGIGAGARAATLR